jgi:tetratricopeptide (TPR) repeat protein
MTASTLITPSGEQPGRRPGETAAMLRGAAEALSVLRSRGAAAPQRASRYAATLLSREVTPTDWNVAGLPAPAAPGQCGAVSRDHDATLHLARSAMNLHCVTLPLAQRPGQWERLAGFFAQYLPPSDRSLQRLRERALNARADAGDVSPAVMTGLRAAFEGHRAASGDDSYLASLARANLAVAYRLRGTAADLDRAIALTAEEVRARTDRYGPAHPFTLVARSLLARALLAQAEATPDEPTRLSLGRQALGHIDNVRAARDRLFGMTAANATLSRRHEGHALLILGHLERARACLEYALAFETARNDNAEYRGSGPTQLLLARVYASLGDRESARDHAQSAVRLLARDSPGGQSHRAATALLHRLEGSESVRD